ncbi:MAG: SRPBCC family protein [Planctomycetota bacterium]
MPRLYMKSLLDAPLEAVWAFHEDTKRGLESLSPPEAEAEVLKADKPAVGAEVIVRAKTPLGRQKVRAVYREWEPPHGSKPHRIAYFVDEARIWPFSQWRHTHRFEETIDEGQTKVWAIDDVRYALPIWAGGVIGARFGAGPQLRKMFKYRHAKLRELLCRRS